MKYIIKQIPRELLTEHKDYVGFLFKNQNAVYNICNTEEDVIKSNQWFLNLPQNVYVVDEYYSNEKINIGDKFIPHCNSENFNNNLFTFIGYHEDNKNFIRISDETGVEFLTTKNIFYEYSKFIRYGNSEDFLNIVNGIFNI